MAGCPNESFSVPFGRKVTGNQRFMGPPLVVARLTELGGRRGGLATRKKSESVMYLASRMIGARLSLLVACFVKS